MFGLFFSFAAHALFVFLVLVIFWLGNWSVERLGYWELKSQSGGNSVSKDVAEWFVGEFVKGTHIGAVAQEFERASWFKPAVLGVVMALINLCAAKLLHWLVVFGASLLFALVLWILPFPGGHFIEWACSFALVSFILSKTPGLPFFVPVAYFAHLFGVIFVLKWLF